MTIAGVSGEKKKMQLPYGEKSVNGNEEEGRTQKEIKAWRT